MQLERPKLLGVRPPVKAAAHPNLRPTSQRGRVGIVEELKRVTGWRRRRLGEIDVPLQGSALAQRLSLNTRGPASDCPLYLKFKATRGLMHL